MFAAPTTVMLETTNAPVPVFESVTGTGMEVEFTGLGVKVIEAGESMATGESSPVPSSRNPAVP